MTWVTRDACDYAGVVPIVNDSGGPKEDILVNLDGTDAFGQPRRAGAACHHQLC